MTEQSFTDVVRCLESSENTPYHHIDHERIKRIVCISDMHSRFCELTIPAGDILICAGDLTHGGYFKELVAFNNWISTLPHKHKIVIAGNHDRGLDPIAKQSPHFQPQDESEMNLSSQDYKNILSNCTYLEFSDINLFGWKIYGLPTSLRKTYGSGKSAAFQVAMGSQEHIQIIKSIPSDVDILVSHGPPYGVGDYEKGNHVGDSLLRKEVEEWLKPRYHIFGHVHASYGVYTNGMTTFINPSSKMVPKSDNLNAPVILDIDLKL